MRLSTRLSTIGFLAAVLVACFAPPARAQAPNVVSYTHEIFASGVSTVTGNPLISTVYQATNVVCNLAKLPVPPTVKNPHQIEFDDPIHTGQACIATLVSTVLPSLPTGTGFLSTLKQTDDAGQTSARSTPSNPFGVQGIPPVITGLSVF